jgi:hypothetical protein
LKRLLTRRHVDVSALEAKPDSTAILDLLREDLTDTDTDTDAVDEELLDAAQQVVDAVAAHDAGAGPAIGIDLSRVQAEFLRIRSVDSTGTGVRVQDGTFNGAIDIGDVRGVRRDRQRVESGGAQEGRRSRFTFVSPPRG